MTAYAPVRHCGHRFPLDEEHCPTCGAATLAPRPQRRWPRRVGAVIVVAGLVASGWWAVPRVQDELDDRRARADEDEAAEARSEADPDGVAAATTTTAPAEPIPVVDGRSGLRWTMQGPPVRRSKEAVTDVFLQVGVYFTTYVAEGPEVDQRVVVYGPSAARYELVDLIDLSHGAPFVEGRDLPPVSMAGREGVARRVRRDEVYGAPAIVGEAWAVRLPDGSAVVATTVAEGTDMDQAPSALALAGSVAPA